MIYQTNARNAALNAITALLDAGGKLVFQTAANAIVATCALSATAFGAAANGVAIANAISDDTNCIGGTIDHAILQTSASVSVIQLSVTLAGGGGEIELEKIAMRAGDILRIESLTLTQPA